jgi:hypothetical protein
LVAIDLDELRHKPMPARSPRAANDRCGCGTKDRAARSRACR